MDFNTYYYEEQGFEIQKLRQIPGLVITSFRQPQLFRWQQHWNGRYSSGNELLANMKQQSYFRSSADVHDYSMMVYFESFNNSLDPKNFDSMFQSADVKPYGRNFLQELAECMAANDPSMYLVGGEPLGSSGRDDETREFAKAFRALPAGAYLDIDKLSDPVCGRYLATEKGTYFYLQNEINADVDVSLKVNESAVDLSANKSIVPDNDGMNVTLKPFELKAFKLNAGVAAPELNSVRVSDATVKNLRDRYEDIADSVKAMTDYGADVTIYTNKLKEFQTAMDQGHFAEAHRLAWCVLFRIIKPQVRNAKLGFLKQQRQMIASGRYAVSCGNADFCQVGSTLFFPDQKYSPGGYGYSGSYTSCQHDASTMKSTVDSALILNEASNVEGYRFTVPNGLYTVRLYNRIGYVPDAGPGRVMMTLEIQGKRVWDKMDLFLALNKDITQVLVSNFNDVEVKDGVLDLTWIPTNGRLGWINAIEIIPNSES